MTSPAITFLHGFLGAPDAWDPLRRGLDAHRADLPVLLGHRDSPSRATGFVEEVDRIAASFTEPHHLVGYSLGGRIALGIVCRHPHLVHSATLIGASAGLGREEMRAERRELDARRAESIETNGLARFVIDWELEPIFRSQLALPGSIRAKHRARRSAHSDSEIASSLRLLSLGAMPFLEPELARSPTPMLFVAGSLDTKFASIARHLAELVPNGRSELVQDAGHDVVLEAPDRLATLIRTFMTTRSNP